MSTGPGLEVGEFSEAGVVEALEARDDFDEDMADGTALGCSHK